MTLSITVSTDWAVHQSKRRLMLRDPDESVASLIARPFVMGVATVGRTLNAARLPGRLRIEVRDIEDRPRKWSCGRYRQRRLRAQRFGYRGLGPPMTFAALGDGSLWICDFAAGQVIRVLPGRF